jgi:hypothetical protein
VSFVAFTKFLQQDFREEGRVGIWKAEKDESLDAESSFLSASV